MKKGKPVKSNITPQMQAYLTFEAEVDKKIAAIDWTKPNAFDAKFSLIDKANREYAKVPLPHRNLYFYGREVVEGLGGLNDAVRRSRVYRKQIEEGVYGRDLIQPYREDGSVNSDFVDHYGTKEYPKEVREQIK